MAKVELRAYRMEIYDGLQPAKANSKKPGKNRRKDGKISAITVIIRPGQDFVLHE